MIMPTERIYVVDRIEVNIAVLVDEAGSETLVPLTRFRNPLHEGSVLRVPIDSKANPQWGDSAVDEAETQKRKQEAEDILRSLRQRDPGGDVEL